MPALFIANFFVKAKRKTHGWVISNKHRLEEKKALPLRECFPKMLQGSLPVYHTKERKRIGWRRFTTWMFDSPPPPTTSGFLFLSLTKQLWPHRFIRLLFFCYNTLTKLSQFKPTSIHFLAQPLLGNHAKIKATLLTMQIKWTWITTFTWRRWRVQQSELFYSKRFGLG